MIKNVISSRGKFASHLYMRNSMVDPKKASKRDQSLGRSSMLLSRTFSKEQNSDDMLFMVNPQNVSDAEKDINTKESKIDENVSEPKKDFKPKSNLTPFLLLIALSLHGFFEGIALGIQGELDGVLFLAAAILAHKWAEAFTLVRLINIEIIRNFFLIYPL
jgi:zinc transporter ZupT